MSYRDFVSEKRRLTILRYLTEENGYSANDSVMHSVVEHFGFNCSRDVVRGDFAWLRDLGLVSVEEVSDDVLYPISIETVVKLGGELIDDTTRLRRLARTLADLGTREPLVVVHGGGRFEAPVMLDTATEAALRGFAPFAPLHQEANLDPAGWLRRAYPDLVQIAVFDDAFHAGMPDVARRLPLPGDVTPRLLLLMLIVDVVVGHYLTLMRAWDEIHATIFGRGVVQSDAYRN